MHLIKQFQETFTWLLFASLLIGCGGGGGGSSTPAVTLDSLGLSEISQTLDVGDSLQLTATGQYSNASTQNLSAQVSWSVANNSVVSVSPTGLLTALAAGTTTVSASLDGVTSIQRSVTVRALASLSVSPSFVTLAINSSQPLSVTGIYTDNTTRDLTDQVSWTSANNAIASVSDDSIVSAYAEGIVDITATLGAIVDTMSVSVSPATLQLITVSSSLAQVAVGLNAQFTAMGLYSDGTQQNLSSQVVWSVSDVSKASMEAETGLLTALQGGGVTVIASKDGVSGTLGFTITPASLSTIQASPALMTLAKGSSQSITLTAIFSDASKQDVSDQVLWSSSAANIANVTPGSSLIEALEVGNATLTASLSGSSVDVSVSVTNAELVSLALNPVNTTVPQGVSQQYVALGTYTDASVQDLSTQVTWLSSDETVAVISNAAASKGRLSTLAVGSAMVKAVYGDIEQTTQLTVDNAQLTSIDIQPTSQTIAKGENGTLQAFGNYTDGKRINITSQVNWSSNDTAYIDLSSAALGTLKTLEQGVAVLSADLEGVTAIATINVSDATLSSISLEAASTSLANGTSLNLIARGHYSDASTRDISAQVTWQSDDSSVLSVANGVNDYGLISGLSVGQANISASLGQTTGQQLFTVTDAVMTGLQISAPVNSLNVNSSVQLTAQASYSDASTQMVTAQVNWSSNDTSIASVDNTQGNKGYVTAHTVGNAQISATLNGVQSNTLALAVTQDANLPSALNFSVQPNAILNDGVDSSQINVNVVPALPEGVIADGTIVTLIITEGETQRIENLTTIDGVARYTLYSTYQGVIILSAALGELVANAGVLSNNNFTLAIARQGFVANISYQDGTLGAGSAFLVILRNISNRSYLIDRVRIGYIDPSDTDPSDGLTIIQLPDSPVTDSASLSDGSLSAGEFTSIGYQMDADVSADVFMIIYEMTDAETSREFSVIQPFTFGP